MTETGKVETADIGIGLAPFHRLGDSLPMTRARMA